MIIHKYFLQLKNSNKKDKQRTNDKITCTLSILRSSLLEHEFVELGLIDPFIKLKKVAIASDFSKGLEDLFKAYPEFEVVCKGGSLNKSGINCLSDEQFLNLFIFFSYRAPRIAKDVWNDRLKVIIKNSGLEDKTLALGKVTVGGNTPLFNSFLEFLETDIENKIVNLKVIQKVVQQLDEYILQLEKKQSTPAIAKRLRKLKKNSEKLKTLIVKLDRGSEEIIVKDAPIKQRKRVRETTSNPNLKKGRRKKVKTTTSTTVTADAVVAQDQLSMSIENLNLLPHKEYHKIFRRRYIAILKDKPDGFVEIDKKRIYFDKTLAEKVAKEEYKNQFKMVKTYNYFIGKESAIKKGKKKRNPLFAPLFTLNSSLLQEEFAQLGLSDSFEEFKKGSVKKGNCYKVLINLFTKYPNFEIVCKGGSIAQENFNSLSDDEFLKLFIFFLFRAPKVAVDVWNDRLKAIINVSVQEEKELLLGKIICGENDFLIDKCLDLLSDDQDNQALNIKVMQNVIERINEAISELTENSNKITILNKGKRKINAALANLTVSLDAEKDEDSNESINDAPRRPKRKREEADDVEAADQSNNTADSELSEFYSLNNRVKRPRVQTQFFISDSNFEQVRSEKASTATTTTTTFRDPVQSYTGSGMDVATLDSHTNNQQDLFNDPIRQSPSTEQSTSNTTRIVEQSQPIAKKIEDPDIFDLLATAPSIFDAESNGSDYYSNLFANWATIFASSETGNSEANTNTFGNFKNNKPQ